NGRPAAPISLGVRRVPREEDGRLALEGAGPAVEHVVWMRRLPADRMLDRLVEDGVADAVMLTRLAALLADFHAGAPADPGVAAHASPEALRRRWTDVLALAAPLVGGPLPRAAHTILADFGPDFIAPHATLLLSRPPAHRIRHR